MLRKSIFLAGLSALILTIQGCATASSNVYDIDNHTINKLTKNSGGTYSDYDKGIVYNSKDKLYHYVIYVGGIGSCDNAAILYAKPKLDKFMKDNNFKSYKIIKGDYILMPMSKCDLSIEFHK